MTRIFAQENSVVNSFLAEMRDVKVQQDRMRFRRNLERTGEVMAYEISKSFEYRKQTIQTPLGESDISLPATIPVVGTILRAGIPLHQGLLNVFDQADNLFISAYRKHHKDGHFDIEIEYISGPDLNGRTLILCDPMLATGASIVRAWESLMSHGKPARLHIVSVIASIEGLQHARMHLPGNTCFWIGEVDDELTAEAYIVPGIGDVGDLAYGDKV